MLKLLIIDDEPLAHQVLQHHCALHPDLSIAGHCYSASEALALLTSTTNSTEKIDLLLLDINMPVLSGLDLLKTLANPPQVIITSAHQEYALDGYAFDVTDYLLKPFSAERFASAIAKVKRRLATAPANQISQASPHIFLKVDRELRKFQLEKITCCEAYGNYVKVWQDKNMTLVNASLKSLRQQLPPKDFIQVHKSFIIHRQEVTSIDNQYLQLSNQMRIKIGDAYRSNVGGIF